MYPVFVPRFIFSFSMTYPVLVYFIYKKRRINDIVRWSMNIVLVTEPINIMYLLTLFCHSVLSFLFDSYETVFFGRDLYSSYRNKLPLVSNQFLNVTFRILSGIKTYFSSINYTTLPVIFPQCNLRVNFGLFRLFLPF